MAARPSCWQQLGLSERPGLFLGKIAVGSKLGEGSYATVHRAEWHGVDVAVKQLHNIFTDTDVVGERGRQLKLQEFGQEIDRLCRLRHPNLTQMFGVGEVDGLPALVTELMSGTLLSRSVGDQRANDETLLGYLADTAAGLRYLHNLGKPLIHRDLALKNVLIGSGRAKLADFGVSKFLDPQNLPARLRQTVAMSKGRVHNSKA